MNLTMILIRVVDIASIVFLGVFCLWRVLVTYLRHCWDKDQNYRRQIVKLKLFDPHGASSRVAGRHYATIFWAVVWVVARLWTR